MNQPLHGPGVHSAPAAPKSARGYRSALVGFLITAFWLIMMFTLLRDRILPQRQQAALAARTVAPATLTGDWKDSEEFMVVKMGPKEVGGAITSVRRVIQGQVPAYMAEFRFGVGLNLLGVVRPATIRARAELDSQFDLNRFALIADLSSYKLEVAGLARNEELLVETRQGGRVMRARYRLDRRITLLDAVRPVVGRNFKIRPGNSIALPVVDPIWSMDHGTLQLTVGDPEEITLDGKKVTAYPLKARLNDFTSTSWVDSSGATLRRQLAGSITMEQAPPGRVRSAFAQLDRPIDVKPVDEADFEGVPITPLKRLSTGGKSPLETLGSLMPR